MNKTILIVRQEFKRMVTRKMFIIITLAFPLLALLAMVVYQFIAGIDKPSTADEEMDFGYVDTTGGFSRFTEQAGISLIPFDSQDLATQALIENKISDYFVIPEDYLTTGVINRYTLSRELEVPDNVFLVMKNFLLSNLLNEQISPQVIDRVKVPIQLVSTRLTTTGEVATEQGGPEAFIVPYVFSLLLILSIFFSSGYLLEGLGEEKENRIMEILLSSVSPRQLLAGKVLGLGAGGLIQMLIWLISAPLLIRMASTTIGGFIGSLQIPPNFIILGIVYFTLGYLFFAVLMAGVGAISPTTREAQQLVPIFTMGAVSPFWFLPFIFDNPNHAVARTLTIFPITAPVTTMARLGLTDIAVWELVLSIGVLAISVVAGLLIAAKVFRIYLLMYGKRPGLRELIHSLRNA